MMELLMMIEIERDVLLLLKMRERLIEAGMPLK
jgi:hypothetical protein